ncbi:FAD-dependent monooxygenase [Streptomyces iranensis]|uniref:2-polyprenyl-6-methoxyphenol hydroxylase-like FAD-dependent oxidoreductase n=2 Tax=Streptomyces iranensis TaxID=576784 RepID=A0A061A174_9ACTN|nr:2-polyprenyl-6-methoxyphenol hydroxylase-like FAD-dependent oxidoreductase [Streptomyces iranensis]CDR14357.1 FAD-binding monooxygenase [Streptomyces iranensis]
MSTEETETMETMETTETAEATERAEAAEAAESTTDVVIAGAGPTGLMLAYELALAGAETLVLEKLDQRIEQVKGGAIQPRTAELLESRGLLEPMLRRAMPRDWVGGHFAMLPVPLDCTPWRTRHNDPIALPQWKIEEVLEERAVAAGARILRSTAVSKVEPDEDGVVVTADGLRVRARYLVACDGGHSTVRKLLELPFPGRAGTHQAVLTDIRLTAVSSLVPKQMGHISTMTRQVGGYWAMLVPVGGDLYRFTFGHEGQVDTARDVPVTHEEIATALREVYGEETTLGAVDNSSRFSDATRQLEQYRVGRVLFAGDAAHIHSPMGGQGLNLGMQDAINLGWKLAAVIQDRAPSGLLDSYHAERHPAAARVLHHTSAQRVLADTNPSEDVAALRDIFIDLLRLPDANRHLAGLMSGLSLRYELPGEHPLTGQRVPDADLVTEDGATRLSALFGSGHAVLLDLAGAVPDGLRLPPRVDLVRATCADDLGAAALLIRPDGYVCWAADTPAACDETLLATIEDGLTKVR